MGLSFGIYSKKRRMLAWLGGGLLFAIMGLWAAGNVWVKSNSSAPTARVQAGNCGVATSGSVSGNSITCTPIVPDEELRKAQEAAAEKARQAAEAESAEIGRKLEEAAKAAAEKAAEDEREAIADAGKTIEKSAHDTGHEIEKGGIAGGPNSVIRDPLAAIRSLGNLVSALPQGDIVLDAPSEMKVGDKRQVDANVGINVPIEDLQKKPQTSNQQIKGKARVSSKMSATLNGAGFKIASITPEIQEIAEGFPTVWSWNVEAQASGEQELEAVLYVFPDGDKNSKLRVKSFTQKINVSVREKTLDEWLKTIGGDVDTVKGIVVAVGGAATMVIGWFGITRARQKSGGAKPTGKSET